MPADSEGALTTAAYALEDAAALVLETEGHEDGRVGGDAVIVEHLLSAGAAFRATAQVLDEAAAELVGRHHVHLGDPEMMSGPAVCAFVSALACGNVSTTISLQSSICDATCRQRPGRTHPPLWLLNTSQPRAKASQPRVWG